MTAFYILSKSDLVLEMRRSPPAIELKEPIAEPKPWLKYLFASTLLLIITFIASAWAIAKFKPDFYGQLLGNATPSAPITPAPVPTPTAVSALKQIEPEGEVIQLSVSSAAESSKVEQLLVQRGDRVKQGQVVAVLDSYNSASAATNKAQTDVRIAQANLERVQAGAKQGDISAQKSSINRLEAELKGQIAAQKAAIARLEAELANANVEYNRYQQLFDDGAISAQERDTRRLRVDTVEQQLAEAKETLNRTIETTNVQRNEAQAKLESIAEVRSVDVQVAQAEVQQARENLALTEVRSPIDGQVLKVNVRPGEVVGAQETVILTGPSGSGKTTLLTLIGGLRSVQSGSLKFLGNELFGASQNQLVKIRRQIGYIFQGHNLLEFLTVRQNVQISLELDKTISESAAKQRAEAILQAVKLGEYGDYYPQQLSGGQKQRVAIARALVGHPKLFLADEPTAALDSQTGKEVISLLQKLASQQDSAILIVTHDHRILNAGDRIIRIEDGRLHC